MRKCVCLPKELDFSRGHNIKQGNVVIKIPRLTDIFTHFTHYIGLGKRVKLI